MAASGHRTRALHRPPKWMLPRKQHHTTGSGRVGPEVGMAPEPNVAQPEEEGFGPCFPSGRSRKESDDHQSYGNQMALLCLERKKKRKKITHFCGKVKPGSKPNNLSPSRKCQLPRAGPQPGTPMNWWEAVPRPSATSPRASQRRGSPLLCS